MILLIFIKYEQPNLNQGAFETSVRASVPEFMHYFTPAKTLFRLHVHYSGNLTELPLKAKAALTLVSKNLKDDDKDSWWLPYLDLSEDV